MSMREATVYLSLKDVNKVHNPSLDVSLPAGCQFQIDPKASKWAEIKQEETNTRIFNISRIISDDPLVLNEGSIPLFSTSAVPNTRAEFQFNDNFDSSVITIDLQEGPSYLSITKAAGAYALALNQGEAPKMILNDDGSFHRQYDKPSILATSREWGCDPTELFDSMIDKS